MSPDDPRHGSRRGYYAHRSAGEDACTACKRGAAAAEARYELNRSRGVSLRVNPTGTRRRLQALCAMGWSFRDIDRQLGLTNMAEKWSREDRSYVFATTAAKVAEVYDRLSMRFPPEETSEQRMVASRARSMARRNEWPPPLAWDDIDNPDERPHGWQRTGTSRADELHDLDERCVGITEACTHLRLKRRSLERWCARHGMSDLFSRLVAREDPPRVWANQFTSGAA